MTPAQKVGWWRVGVAATIAWVILALAGDAGSGDRPRDVLAAVLLPPLVVWIAVYLAVYLACWVRAGFRGE